MKNWCKIILIFLIIGIIGQIVLADEIINVDYYYSQKCGTCRIFTEEVINPIEENFTGRIIIKRIDVNLNKSNRLQWLDQGFKTYPAAVINNETKIPKRNLTYSEMEKYINLHLQSIVVNKSFNEDIIEIPFIGIINSSNLSLPILTIVLGGLDSFNPCSFFILIFLLNLLIYVQSRRRMILIGGIFIFFSGFFYLLFMFILFNSLLLTPLHVDIISILAGIVAISIGIFNIKDYFYFKKGISLSLSEDKQREIFKKMRRLIKTSYLPAIIGGAVFLAITVNFYELLCTLGFPLIYTTRLSIENLSIVESSLYIFLYNFVYVIPLIIILLIFVYTLGRRKITEIQGRKLKLLSGIMIFIFGIFFIIDHAQLENFFTPILILISSILITLLISYVWAFFENRKSDFENKT
jgi:hypothetical protein